MQDTPFQYQKKQKKTIRIFKKKLYYTDIYINFIV